jgi:hypothetical protein
MQVPDFSWRICIAIPSSLALSFMRRGRNPRKYLVARNGIYDGLRHRAWRVAAEYSAAAWRRRFSDRRRRAWVKARSLSTVCLRKAHQRSDIPLATYAETSARLGCSGRMPSAGMKQTWATDRSKRVKRGETDRSLNLPPLSARKWLLLPDGHAPLGLLRRYSGAAL